MVQDVGVALAHPDRGSALETGSIVPDHTAPGLLGSPRIRAAYLVPGALEV